MRVTAFDDFTVKFQHQTQNAMRRRVLRAEVQVEIADLLFAGLEIARTVVIAVAADIPVHHHLASAFWSPGRM